MGTKSIWQYAADRFGERKFQKLKVLGQDGYLIRLGKQTLSVGTAVIRLLLDMVKLPVVLICKDVIHFMKEKPKSGFFHTLYQKPRVEYLADIAVDTFAIVFDSAKLVFYGIEGLGKGAGYLGHGIGKLSRFTSYHLFDKQSTGLAYPRMPKNVQVVPISTTKSNKPTLAVAPIVESEQKTTRPIEKVKQKRAAPLSPPKIKERDEFFANLQMISAQKSVSDSEPKQLAIQWKNFTSDLAPGQRQEQNSNPRFLNGISSLHKKKMFKSSPKKRAAPLSPPKIQERDEFVACLLMVLAQKVGSELESDQLKIKLENFISGLAPGQRQEQISISGLENAISSFLEKEKFKSSLLNKPEKTINSVFPPLIKVS